MDYNNNQNIPPYGGYNQQSPSFHNLGLTMASVSLFLGLGAVFTLLTVFLPLALGGLAILLALLSKGYGKKMLTQARIGFICGIGSFCVTVGIFISSFAVLFSNPDMLVEYGQQYDAMCENVYGQSSEELFGFSFEDMMEEYADILR